MIDYCHQPHNSFAFTNFYPIACPTFTTRRNNKKHNRSLHLVLYTLDNSPSNQRTSTTPSKMKTKSPVVIMPQQHILHSQHQYTHYEPLLSYSQHYQQQHSFNESNARRRSCNAKQQQQRQQRQTFQLHNHSSTASLNRSSRCASPAMAVASVAEHNTPSPPLSSSPSFSSTSTAAAPANSRAATANNRMSYSAIVQSTSFQGNSFRKATSRMAAQVTRTHPQRSHSSSSLPDMQGKHGYYHSRLQHHDYEDDVAGHPHWDDTLSYYNSAQQTQHSLASQGLHTPQHHISENGTTHGQQHLHRQQQQQEQQWHHYSHTQYPPLGAVYHRRRQSFGNHHLDQPAHYNSSACSYTASPPVASPISVSVSTPTVIFSTTVETALPESSSCAPAQSALGHAASDSMLTLSNGRGENGLLQVKSLDELAAAAANAVAANSDPEPCPDAKAEQPGLQTNVHGHPIDASDRSNASNLVSRPQTSELLSANGSLHQAIEYDESSLSSVRETSDSDDERSQGSATDPFEDQLGHNARRSKKARSLQRLLRKNRMLESSLVQAQRDLQQEREARKIVEECHIKARDDLEKRLGAQEDENDRLLQELEETRKEVAELKQRAYRIDYDSSPYSLASGLASIGGGLMLHHSSLINGCDDSDEFFLPNSLELGCHSPSTTDTTPTATGTAVVGTAKDTPARSQMPLMYGTSDDEDEQSNSHVVGSTVDVHADSVVCLVDDNDDSAIQDSQETTNGVADALKDNGASAYAGSDTSNLSQDGGICYPESFELLAQSHLQQAIVAKLTTAMTILQLDDLAMKYDASPQDLLTVLINEMAKWWEMARLKAGGPANGGWGPMTTNPNGKGITNNIRESVERDFRQYFGPLLFHYISNHQDQLLVLKRLEEHSSSSVVLRENQPFQLMVMFKSDILDRDAILEWWRLLEEPKRIFGHGQDIRSLTAKFIAFLETHEDDDEDEDEDSEDEYDSEDESDDSDSDDLEEDDEDDDGLLLPHSSNKGSVRIIGLEQLHQSKGSSESSNQPLPALNSDSAHSGEQLASSPDMLVIGSEDGEDDRSTTSSLERLEARERERRISFCAHPTVFGEDSSDEEDDEEDDGDDETTDSVDDQKNSTA